MECRELFRFRDKPVVVTESRHVSLKTLWVAGGSPAGDLHWTRFLDDPKTQRRKARIERDSEVAILEDAQTFDIFIHPFLASQYAEDLSVELWYLVRQHLFGEDPGAGSNSAKSPRMGQIDILRGALDVLAQHEEAIADHDKRIASIEADKARAIAQAKQLPAPKPGAAPAASLRSRANMVVRNYAQLYGRDYESLWAKAYRELAYRCHVDIKARVKKSGKRPIQVVEEAGFMDDLYAIVWEFYGAPDRLGFDGQPGVES